MKKNLSLRTAVLGMAAAALLFQGIPVQAASLKTSSETMEVPAAVPLTAQSALLYDINKDVVTAKKNETLQQEPGDFTRLAALLVACENIYSPADRVTITQDVIDTAKAQGGTCLFQPGETVSVQDLMYATVLTGADDAVLALGRKAAGADAVFTALLNRKANQLGLKNTLFQNATGISGQGSYMSAEDAVILVRACMQNKKSYAVLLQPQWTIGATSQHPQGIQIGSDFKMTMNIMPVPGMENNAYSLSQGSSFGALSLFQSWHGKPYICVTMGSSDYVSSINDQANLFLAFVPGV